MSAQGSSIVLQRRLFHRGQVLRLGRAYEKARRIGSRACDKGQERRYLIENLFGTVKQKLSSHIRVRDKDIAMKFALIRILIFNLYALLHDSPQIFFVLVCGFISSLPKSPTKRPFRANLPSAPLPPPTVCRRNKLFRTASL